jgi:hypothetical protein
MLGDQAAQLESAAAVTSNKLCRTKLIESAAEFRAMAAELADPRSDEAQRSCQSHWSAGSLSGVSRWAGAGLAAQSH